MKRARDPAALVRVVAAAAALYGPNTVAKGYLSAGGQEPLRDAKCCCRDRNATIATHGNIMTSGKNERAEKCID